MKTNLCVKVLLSVALFTIVLPATAPAQISQLTVKVNLFPSKLVCGFQTGNVPLLNEPFTGGPYEQVKPGNYAFPPTSDSSSMLFC